MSREEKVWLRSTYPVHSVNYQGEGVLALVGPCQASAVFAEHVAVIMANPVLGSTRPGKLGISELEDAISSLIGWRVRVLVDEEDPVIRNTT